MKLTYYQGAVPNFGYELNPYLWGKLLPSGFLDEDDSELFFGIGSIRWDNLPKAPRKLVVGAGYAGYTANPDVHDGSWEIIFVRGPRTAALLGLPPEKAICDSAVLLRALQLPGPTGDIGVAFMPHVQSLDRGLWAEACRIAGIRMIDPTDDVEKVISEVKGAKVLITEAIHGAIVADAMRTPWIALRPIESTHHQKWYDWSEALDIPLRQHTLWPSSALEAYVRATGGRGDPSGRAGQLNRSAILRPVNAMLTYSAAQRLINLARHEPQLSRDDRISDVTERARTAVEQLVMRRSRGEAA